MDSCVFSNEFDKLINKKNLAEEEVLRCEDLLNKFFDNISICDGQDIVKFNSMTDQLGKVKTKREHRCIIL